MDPYMVPASMTEREYRERAEYSVWTYNEDREWMRRNGVADMVIVGNVSLCSADFMVERLKLVNPKGRYFIRNNKNVILSRPVKKES